MDEGQPSSGSRRASMRCTGLGCRAIGSWPTGCVCLCSSWRTTLGTSFAGCVCPRRSSTGRCGACSRADQDGRPSGAARPVVDISVVRGVGSSTVVRGSAGSYRPVIAGAKLREGATTISPRGRALQGVALSSMRFHPTGRGHEDDEDGQEGCSTTANASLIG